MFHLLRNRLCYLHISLLMIISWSLLTSAENPTKRIPKKIQQILDPYGLLSAGHGLLENVGASISNGADTFNHRMGQVHAGIKEAGKVVQIVGEDLSNSVSSIMSEHLRSNTLDPYGRDSDTSDERQREGIMTSLLRMIGLDTNQLALMALNVLIFVAEMITTSIMGGDINSVQNARSTNTDNFLLNQVLEYNSKKVDELLLEVQDPGLPRSMIEQVGRAMGNRGHCVQLLVCKASPLVWSFQKYIKTALRNVDGKEDEYNYPLQDLYESLPELNDFLQFSTECEKQFSSCTLLSLRDLYLS